VFSARTISPVEFALLDLRCNLEGDTPSSCLVRLRNAGRNRAARFGVQRSSLRQLPDSWRAIRRCGLPSWCLHTDPCRTRVREGCRVGKRTSEDPEVPDSGLRYGRRGCRVCKGEHDTRIGACVPKSPFQKTSINSMEATTHVSVRDAPRRAGSDGHDHAHAGLLVGSARHSINFRRDLRVVNDRRHAGAAHDGRKSLSLVGVPVAARPGSPAFPRPFSAGLSL
jgi:hypothetical protein